MVRPQRASKGALKIAAALGVCGSRAPPGPSVENPALHNHLADCSSRLPKLACLKSRMQTGNTARLDADRMLDSRRQRRSGLLQQLHRGRDRHKGTEVGRANTFTNMYDRIDAQMQGDQWYQNELSHQTASGALITKQAHDHGASDETQIQKPVLRVKKIAFTRLEPFYTLLESVGTIVSSFSSMSSL